MYSSTGTTLQHVSFNLRCRQSRLVSESLKQTQSRVLSILWSAQNQLPSERIRRVHFTIDAQDQLELKKLLPYPILEFSLFKFVARAQRTQHSKGKERQLQKFPTLLMKTYTSQSTHTQYRQEQEDFTTKDSQEK